MALIGQGAIPVPINYTFGNDAWRMTQATTSAIQGALDAGVDLVQDRREKKDAIKVSKELAKALGTLYPETMGAVQPIIDQLDDEEIPLSQRAALGDQIGQLINMGVEKTRYKDQQALANRGMAIQEGEYGLRAVEQGQRMAALQDELAKREREEGLRIETEAAVAPEILKQVLQQTAAMEKAGKQVGIPSKTLQDALNAAEPSQQMKIAETALSMMPKAVQEQINYNTPVTIDGQPGTAATGYNPATGSMRIIPVQDPISQGSDGVFTVPTTNYSQGAAVGGPDEMQDKWTNKGYSSTGKNLTKGVVAVNDSVFPLGTVFRDTGSGEVFIAADRHGNRDSSVVDFYQPPGEYTAEKGKRNLEVIGNVKPADTVEGIQAQIAQFQKPKVTAGAVKREAPSMKETPAEATAKRRAEMGDKRLAEIETGAATLSSTLPNLYQTKELLEKVDTGFGAETILAAQRMLPGVDVSDKEQLQTLLGDQVMARVAQTKGAVSEREMDLFQKFSANFGKTTDGNKKIVDFAIKAAERAKKIEIAIAAGMEQGKSAFEINRDVKAIQDADPLESALQGGNAPRTAIQARDELIRAQEKARNPNR